MALPPEVAAAVVALRRDLDDAAHALEDSLVAYFSTPVPPDPIPPEPIPATSRTVGVAIACDSKGNLHCQKGANAFVFVSRGGTPKIVRFPWTDRDGGYGQGDGGAYDVYLTKTTSGHVPDRGALVSGRTRWYRGSRSQNTITANVDVTSAQPLVAGVQYALVIENVHASPDANWGCLNLPYLHGEKVPTSLQPRWPANECRTLVGSSPYVAPFAWSGSVGASMTHLPSFDVEYSDGRHDGFSGIRATSTTDTGHSKVTTTPGDLYRMRFVAPFDATLTKLWLRVSRQSGSASGDLTYAVRSGPSATSRGTLLAEGKVKIVGVQTRDHGSASEVDGGDWRSCAIATTLRKGTSYALEVSAPVGTQVWTPGILLRDSAPGTPMASWPFDEATYWFEGSSNGGASWAVTWSAWGDKHVPQMYADVA